MKDSNVETSWVLALLAKRCEIRISNFASCLVARGIVNLWWAHANFIPFPVENRTNFAAFLLFYVVLHEGFLLCQISRLQADLERKPICILSHVFDIILYYVTCWLLASADLLLKKAVPLFA